ncbi:MAG: apolipoprotein N-acyltransferase [Methylococcaceae bacterium]|nr:apolipoprotein N-acyltransferase [Methylococcaceae bacterium]
MNLSNGIWNLITFLAGLLLTLSFAPFDHAYLAIISLVALFLSWQAATSPKQAALRGYIYGLGLFGLGVTWVFVSIYFYGGASFFASASMAFLFAAFWALFPALTAYISVKVAFLTDKRWLLWITPFVWVLIEYVRGFWLLNGFPWFQISYSQLDTAYAGFVPLFGAYGTSFLVLMTASLVAYMLSMKQRLIFSSATISLILITGYALKHVEWTEAIGKPIKITLAQGNVSQDQKWRPENLIKTLLSYQQMTYSHWDSDVIIWPETAIPSYLHRIDEHFLKPLAAEARLNNTDLIVSLPSKSADGKQSYNTVLTLGTERGIYHKNHLLPFGEYLPWQPVSGWVLDLIGVHLGSFTAGGDNQALLKAGGYFFGTSICYEDAFASESLRAMPDAAYLVNVTNDGWFGNTLEPHQHMQIARMRALETGRYLARATNTGLTAFVAPNGKIIKQAPLFETSTITENILPMGGMTIYARLGDGVIICFLAFLFLGLLVFIVFKRDKNITA